MGQWPTRPETHPALFCVCLLRVPTSTPCTTLLPVPSARNARPQLPPAATPQGLHLKDIAWKESQITFSLLTGPCTCQRHQPDANTATLQQGARLGAQPAAGPGGSGEGAGGTATGKGNGTRSGSGSGAAPDGGQAQAQATHWQAAGGGAATVPCQGAGGDEGCMGGQGRTDGEDGRGGLRSVGGKRKGREGKSVGGGTSSGSGAAVGDGGKPGQRQANGGVPDSNGVSAGAGAQGGVPCSNGRGVAEGGCEDPEPQSDEQEADDGRGRGCGRMEAGGAGAATAWRKGHQNHWLKHLPPQEVWDARRAAIAERGAGCDATNPARAAPLDFGPPPPKQLRCRCPCHNGPPTWVRIYSKNGEGQEAEEEEEEEEESQGPQGCKPKGGRAARRATVGGARVLLPVGGAVVHGMG